MNKIISYIGWIGHNNLGDEALYLSNRRIFDGFELVDREYYDGSEISIYGGGTVLPHPEHPESHSNELIAAIGVGVKDPVFRNQPFAPIDINYSLGRSGLTHLLSNRYIRYALRQLESKFDAIKIRQEYLTKMMFRELNNIDYLGVRGPRSKEILAQYNINCEVVGDTALTLEPSKYIDQPTNKIAVTLKAGGDTMKWSNENNYVEIVKAFCKSYSNEYKFMFLPFRPRDIPLHIELAESIENAEFKDYCSYIDVQAVIDEFAECDAILGERLHASVFSACSYTPFLTLGYQPKSLDFVRSIEMEDFHVRIGHLTQEWLEKKILEIKSSREINNQLKSRVNEKRLRMKDFTNKIINDIDI